MDIKLEHSSNAQRPIEVTLSGKVIDVKLEHPENAPLAIEVTLSGIVIDVKLEQPENAYSPIEVTLLGIIVDLQPTISSLLSVCIIALQLFLESYTLLFSSTFMDVRLGQSSNVVLPLIEVTLSGIVIEVKLEHPENAPLAIEVTLSGIVIEVKLEHPKNAQ